MGVGAPSQGDEETLKRVDVTYSAVGVCQGCQSSRCPTRWAAPTGRTNLRFNKARMKAYYIFNTIETARIALLFHDGVDLVQSTNYPLATFGVQALFHIMM
eukprot:scaffold54848_cov46-Attheya_sp.AAC.3